MERRIVLFINPNYHSSKNNALRTHKDGLLRYLLFYDWHDDDGDDDGDVSSSFCMICQLTEFHRLIGRLAVPLKLSS